MTGEVNEHTHRWQPGPKVDGWRASHTGGSSAPDTIILVCKCGALLRRVIPPYAYPEKVQP